ncbi:MAG: hypothetical protein ACREN4_09410 [Candidatus Dormibacteria bacterium]
MPVVDLEDWQRAQLGPLGPRHAPGHRARTLLAAPRTLRAEGGAAVNAWELAAAGAAHGTAYRLPDGGWHWLGMVDDGTAATVLTIGPTGQRSAERYGSAADPEISQADDYFAERSEIELACPTPDAFGNLLRTGRLPEPEPELQLAPELPALAIMPEPEPEPTGWHEPERALPWVAAVAAPRPAPRPAPVAPVPVAEAAPQLGRRTLREWVRDQVRALVGPWLAEVPPQIELPRMIRLDNGGPEPATT